MQYCLEGVLIMYRNAQYPFLYETHLHTCQSSACARCTGYDMAKACHEAGYTGMFVTDHNWDGNTAVDRSLPWKQWVDTFAEGFRDARRYGLEHDFDVFFGYEAGYNGTEFLIYGITPEWLAAHPELRNATVEEQYRLVHAAGGMVIHAHPFREEWYIPEIRLFPEYVDGVEGINATHSSHLSGCHNDPAYDRRAIAYALAHGLPMSAGSDIHTTDLFGGGVAFKRRLTSAQDYCRAILSDEDRILTNGDTIFDKYGSIKEEIL